MTFAQEGLGAMALSGVTAITVLSAAVWRRSWSLWLLGILMLILSACVAWTFRDPSRGRPPSAGATITATSRAPLRDGALAAVCGPGAPRAAERAA